MRPNRLLPLLALPLPCVALALALAGTRGATPVTACPQPPPACDYHARTVIPTNGWLPISGNDPRPAFDVRECPEIARIYALFPGKDAIAALQSASFTTAAEALWLDDRAPVLGLKLGTEARCYPLAILNWHSLVHDRVAGQALYVFFDPPSGLAVARRARAQSRPMGLSGYAFDGVGLTYEIADGRLYDMLSGRWLNLTPSLEKGFGAGDTDWLPLERMTWRQWRRRHGNTLVLSRDTGYRYDYSFDPYTAAALGPGGAVEDYWSSNTLLAPETLRDREQILPDKAFVLGFMAGEEPWAVALDDLRATTTLTLATTAGAITIHADPGSDWYYAETGTGHPVPQVRLFWYAWKAHFPQTKVYQKQEAIETDE